MEQLTGDLLDTAATAHGRLGPHGILYEGAEVPARDGVALDTDVYHPAGRVGGPVVLMRTPYGKANWRNDGIYWSGRCRFSMAVPGTMCLGVPACDPDVSPFHVGGGCGHGQWMPLSPRRSDRRRRPDRPGPLWPRCPESRPAPA